MDHHILMAQVGMLEVEVAEERMVVHRQVIQDTNQHLMVHCVLVELMVAVAV
jgi:hypothetical protein